MRTQNCLYTFALVLISLLGPLASQSQTVDWLRFPRNNGQSQGRSAATLSNGDLYQWSIFVDTVVIDTDTLVGGAGFDSFLAKYDQAGQLDWALEAESFGSVQPSDMLTDDNDNAYVVAGYDQGIRWDGTIYNSGSGPRIFISKVSPAGAVDWVLQAESGSNVSKYYLAYGDGNIYVTGRYLDSLNLGPFQVQSPEWGIFLAQIDTNGTVMWLETMQSGATGISETMSIGLDPTASTIYLSGAFKDTLSRGTDTLFSEKEFGGFLVSFDDTGSLTQSASLVASTGAFQGLRLAVSPVGQLFFTTRLSDSLFIDGDTLLSASLPALSQTVVFAYEFKSGMGWHQILSAPTAMEIADFEASSKGQLYVSGTFQDALSMGGLTEVDPTPGSINSYLANLDASGKPEWLLQYGSGVGASGSVNRAHLDNQERIVVVGATSGPVTIGSFNAPNTNQHYFMARITDDSIPSDLPVWPGDCDDGFLVSEKDILPIGLAFGSVGPARPNASLAWTAQPSPKWSDSLKSGINRAFADTDGNGTVYWDDSLAFTVNFDSVHLKASTATTGGIPLAITFLSDTISESDTIVAVVSLGDSSFVIDSLYGITFKFKYDPTHVDSGEVWVDYGNSFVGTKNVDMITVDHDNYTTGNVHIGMCRTNQTNISGAGEICRVTIVMIDDIAGKKEFDFEESMEARTEDILAITYAEDTLSFASGVDSFLLVPAKKRIIVGPGDVEVSVYPNPVAQRVKVSLTGQEGEGIKLNDLQGRCVRAWDEPFQSRTLDLEGLAPGLYILEIHVLGTRICYKLLKE